MKFRFGMTVLIAAAASLYFPLNHSLTGGFNLSTPLDAWIPLWPGWVIPYLLCLPVWLGGLIWAAWKMNKALFPGICQFGIICPVVGCPVLLCLSHLCSTPGRGGEWLDSAAFDNGLSKRWRLQCLSERACLPDFFILPVFQPPVSQPSLVLDTYCCDRSVLNVIYAPTLPG